jgi:hypothetical protein
VRWELVRERGNALGMDGIIYGVEEEAFLREAGNGKGRIEYYSYVGTCDLL